MLEHDSSPEYCQTLKSFRAYRERERFPEFAIFCGSAGKESACNAGDLGLIPGLGRSPGEGKGYPLQYSGLENSIDCIVHGVAKSCILLSDFHCHFTVHVDSQQDSIGSEGVIIFPGLPSIARLIENCGLWLLFLLVATLSHSPAYIITPVLDHQLVCLPLSIFSSWLLPELLLGFIVVFS